MKLRTLLTAMTLCLFACTAWAEGDVVIVVNKDNKVEKLSTKDLQDFYLGEADKYSETKVRAKLCMNTTAKEGFFKKIDLSENQAEANKAKLIATGKSDTVIKPKPVSTSADVVEYISRNADGGLCFLPKADYDKLSDADKKLMKVVN